MHDETQQMGRFRQRRHRCGFAGPNWPITWLKPVILMLAVGTPLASAQGGDTGLDSWDFTATLDGEPIGSHHFDVADSIESRTVDARAAFDVTLLRIPVYRYRIHDHERWQEGCLRGLRSESDDDGKLQHVDQEFKGECLMSFAYWDPRIVTQTRLVNPQTGDIEAVRFERLRDQVLTISGKPELARGWLLQSPKQRISVWYSASTGRWVGLDARVRGGRVLSYRPSASNPGSAR